MRLASLLAILFITVLFSPRGYAEDPKEDDKALAFGQVYGIHTGPLLPNQMPGMTEIMPMWGIRYGFPMRKSLVEFGIANARAKGVEYYNGSVSFRGDYHLEDMYALVYAGLDTHYYTPMGSPYTMYFGGHVGGGFAAHLSDLLWFRTDMKFNLNPGTALYIGFGLEWRASASDNQDQK